MNEPAADDLLVVGKITGCYGVKGWVKIHSYTEPRENFLRFGEWRLKRRGALEPVEFDQGRSQGKGLVAHIVGVDDRNLAETYSGLEVAVPGDSLPQLEEGTRVSFETEEDRRGRGHQAVNLQLIED